MSPGDDEDVRLGHARLEPLRDRRRASSGSSWRSTRVAPVRANVARATSMGTMIVRPEPGERPEARQDPDDSEVLDPVGAEERQLAAEPVAILRGQLLRDEHDGLVDAVELGPARKGQVVQAEVRGRVDARGR